MSKNVMLSVLAMSGDRENLRAAAALEFARSAVYGWSDGDVSIMLDTAAACRKTRTGRALADTLRAFADVLRVQRTGRSVVHSDDADNAWRAACYLPPLPDFAGAEGKAQRKLLGLGADGKLGGWAVAVSGVWLDAVDKHMARAKATADKARQDKKDVEDADAAAAAEALAAAKALETEEETAETSPESAQDAELARLRSVVVALTTENDRLTTLLAAADFAQELAVSEAVGIALAEAQQQRENGPPAFIAAAKLVKTAQKARKPAAA